MKTKAVRVYVITQNFLSEVAEPYSVGKSSILIWLKQIDANYHSTKEFENIDIQSGGYILIDGKEVKIKWKKNVLLIACDALTGEFLSLSCMQERKLSRK